MADERGGHCDCSSGQSYNRNSGELARGTPVETRAKAREQIDEQLQAAGWTVQSRDETNLGAARGVAVCEFPLTTGFADYMLFAEGRPIGVVEAKAAGTTLSGVEPQALQVLRGAAATAAPAGLARPAALPLRVHRRGDLLRRRPRPRARSRRVFYLSPARDAGRMGRW